MNNGRIVGAKFVPRCMSAEEVRKAHDDGQFHHTAIVGEPGKPRKVWLDGRQVLDFDGTDDFVEVQQVSELKE